VVLHVGDVVVVETQTATALGEVRRPRRAIPEFRRDRLYRRVVGLAPRTTHASIATSGGARRRPSSPAGGSRARGAWP